MTPEEIRAEMKKRKWRYVDLAERLKIKPRTLSNAVLGTQKMTPALEAHIDLFFEVERLRSALAKVKEAVELFEEEGMAGER